MFVSQVVTLHYHITSHLKICLVPWHFVFHDILSNVCKHCKTDKVKGEIKIHFVLCVCIFLLKRQMTHRTINNRTLFKTDKTSLFFKSLHLFQVGMWFRICRYTLAYTGWWSFFANSVANTTQNNKRPP